MNDDSPNADIRIDGGEPVSDRSVDAPDVRLYVPDAQDWTALIKQDSEKTYCYQKNPGDTHFHMILAGEIYLTSVDEKLCLQCALRRGVATQDRLYWQNRVRRASPSH